MWPIISKGSCIQYKEIMTNNNINWLSLTTATVNRFNRNEDRCKRIKQISFPSTNEKDKKINYK